MKILLLIPLLFMTGCGDMSRAEVIKAVKECEAGGMEPALIVNGWTYKTDDVVCTIKPHQNSGGTNPVLGEHCEGSK